MHIFVRIPSIKILFANEVFFAEPKRDGQSRREAPAGFEPMNGMGGNMGGNEFAALPGDDNDLPF